MTSALRHPALIRLCQIATGILFGVAGLAKVGDLAGFASQIHNFRVVPVASENLVAMTLPWVEIVAALALILGLRARAAARLAAASLAVFTLAVLLALVRGLDIECGCFGTADASRVGAVKVLQNLGFLAVALVAGLSSGASAASGRRD
jgi:uncharacterized membrane protein YphA (DoxX/SURF4 family)